ncbi:MAG: hypothetical protein ACJAQ9_001791 [Ilumatobacter sp.]
MTEQVGDVRVLDEALMMGEKVSPRSCARPSMNPFGTMLMVNPSSPGLAAVESDHL